MNKHICIHGHFYQPPRENPWLNEVEIQDSAYPFHDWNSRISAECYARNAASRVLDHEGKIEDIVNNYASISFNFGPTLLEWMARWEPDTYQAILDADKASQGRFSGHGSAIAQAYNHMIMPLANDRDKETQIIWGIRDFEHRFGRKPEGMWCGETAMNTPTLELLAKHGIKFTILSPYQAQSVRRMGDTLWHDVTGARVDTNQAYRCNLPSGNHINLFFYDGPISRGIAFEHMLDSGEVFSSRLLDQIRSDEQPQLMHIATDGETYGHHHRFGEMALSYCLDRIEKSGKATLTIYGEFLEHYPPEYEAQIIENTSWSCDHGVERWKSNCGCSTGAHGDWNQNWRAPVRIAFDWVRDQLIPVYEREMKQFTADPWQVRDAYIGVVLDRSEVNVAAFLAKHAGGNLSYQQQVKFLQLLEIQFHTMLMYTSCGWFFDEVTGIETMQDIFYAARAIQLAKQVAGVDLEEEFIRLLEFAPSNVPTQGNAGNAYRCCVKPAIVDMLRVGGHYAVSSLFAKYPEEIDLYSYAAKADYYDYHEAGKYRLALGKTNLHSRITWEESAVSFAVLHLGEHQFYGGVRKFGGEEAFSTMQEEITDAFDKGRVQEVLLLMDKHFGTHNYSFWHLFRDDQKRIIEKVLDSTLANVEGFFRQIYENHYPLMLAFKDLNMALPTPFKMTGDFVVNAKIRRMLENGEVDLKELRNLKDELNRMKVELDYVTLNYLATRRISEAMERWAADPEDVSLVRKAIDLIEVSQQLSLKPELWKAKNIAFHTRKHFYPAVMDKRLRTEGNAATEWHTLFESLMAHLNLKPLEIQSVPDLQVAAE